MVRRYILAPRTICWWNFGKKHGKRPWTPSLLFLMHIWVTLGWRKECKKEEPFAAFEFSNRRTRTACLGRIPFFLNTRRRTCTIVQKISDIDVLVSIPWFWYSFKPEEKADTCFFRLACRWYRIFWKREKRAWSFLIWAFRCARLKGRWWGRREKHSYEKLLYVFA